MVRRGVAYDASPMAKPDAILPTNVAALQAMVLAQRSELATARAGIMAQRFEIEALKARLAKLLRMTFGRSSEKLREQIEQLELTLGDIDENLAETAAPSSTPQTHARTKPARRPLPPALPRDTVEHAAPCCDKTGACLDCGGALRPLGEDVTEILDYVPGAFRVIRHVRPPLPFHRLRRRNLGPLRPSCHAARARQSRRPQLPACRSAAAGLAPGCSPTCWWRSIATTCRCTALSASLTSLRGTASRWPRSTPATRSTCRARRSPTWWARWRAWCGRWSMLWPATSCRARACTPTTPWCRCWNTASGAPARPGYGRVDEMLPWNLAGLPARLDQRLAA